jgi:hypothetical protein
MFQLRKASRRRASSWVLALGDPCEAADLSEAMRGRVRAQQVLAILRMTPALTVANIVNACALVLALYLSGQLSPPVALWALLAVVVALLTFRVAHRDRGAPFPASMRQETCNKVVRNAALFGILWAVPGVHFLPATGGMAQAFIAALLTGMIGGGALALHPIPAAAIVFIVPVTAGGLLGVARTGDPALIGFILIAMAFFFVVARNILRHSELFVSEFVGRLELEEKNRLIAQLLDEARSEARERGPGDDLSQKRVAAVAMADAQTRGQLSSFAANTDGAADAPVTATAANAAAAPSACPTTTL